MQCCLSHKSQEQDIVQTIYTAKDIEEKQNTTYIYVYVQDNLISNLHLGDIVQE